MRLRLHSSHGVRFASVVALAAAGLVTAACRARSAPSTSDSLGTSATTPGAAGTSTPTSNPTSTPGTTPTAAPQLASIAPMKISLGKGEVPTLVLTGSGFVAGAHGAFGTGGNSVRVGPATFDSVAANNDGTTIRFALPLNYTDTTAKGRPQSFTPGEYRVSVVTPKGTSNSLTLTMIQ